MTVQPHERPEVTEAVTYTVALTITVEGGRAAGTGDRRARRVAERLANTAVRTPGVVEVTATAGRSDDGVVAAPERVHFAEANAGDRHAADYLDRFVDPDHEVALRSLSDARANAQDVQRRERDPQQRPETPGIELEL
jgi:hypothetical protein